MIMQLGINGRVLYWYNAWPHALEQQFESCKSHHHAGRPGVGGEDLPASPVVTAQSCGRFAFARRAFGAREQFGTDPIDAALTANRGDASLLLSAVLSKLQLHVGEALLAVCVK